MVPKIYRLLHFGSYSCKIVFLVTNLSFFFFLHFWSILSSPQMVVRPRHVLSKLDTCRVELASNKFKIYIYINLFFLFFFLLFFSFFFPFSYFLYPLSSFSSLLLFPIIFDRPFSRSHLWLVAYGGLSPKP